MQLCRSGLDFKSSRRLDFPRFFAFSFPRISSCFLVWAASDWTRGSRGLILDSEIHLSRLFPPPFLLEALPSAPDSFPLPLGCQGYIGSRILLGCRCGCALLSCQALFRLRTVFLVLSHRVCLFTDSFPTSARGRVNVGFADHRRPGWPGRKHRHIKTHRVDSSS